MQHEDTPRLVDEAPVVMTTALGASGMGLWTYDVQRDLLTWDEAMRQMFGAAPRRSAEYLALLVPEDRDKAERSIARAIETGIFEDLECRFRRPDGSVRWSLCRGRADRDAAGRVVRLLGGAVDVTERHLLNERLVTSQRLESLGNLAAGIAHDFNNMLTAILGRAAMAIEHIPEGLPHADALRGDLAELRKAAERTAALTHGLLAFGRHQTHQPARLHLDALVRQSQCPLRAMLGQDVELALELRSTFRVLADGKQLEQVLVALAVNAREAMPHGGRITVTTADRVAADGSATVRLSFRDSGLGIAPEHLGRVFEPFFTTKAPGTGAGLGLPMVYGIVAQHRGVVWVESEVGRGTAFHIELPVLARPATDPRLPVTMPEAVRGAPATVLVVEDEELVRTTAVRGLELHGFKVMASSSGPEALQVLRSTPIDLVLSDVVMPQMSGQELAAAIRAVWPTMKILFMSGYSEADLGGLDLVAKPFTPALLAERVKTALARTA